MAITKMRLVKITSDEHHYEDILRKLVDATYFHPELATAVINEENGGMFVNEDKRYSQMYNLLTSMNNSFKFINFACDYTEYSYEDIKMTLERIQPEFRSIEEQLSHFSHMSKEDLLAIEKLREYDFEVLNNLNFYNVVFGRIPITSARKLELFDIDNMIYDILHKNNQYYWVLCITGQKDYESTKELLHSLYFEPLEIPKVDDKKVIETYRQELSSIYCYLKYRAGLYDLYKYLVRFDDTYCVTGFVPEDKVVELKALFKNNPNITVSDHDAMEDETLVPPTKLKNGIFSRPFEMFVEMYGTPHYCDIDPTFLVSISYCLLFGLMFGDLGQGLVLVLGGYYFAKKKQSRLGSIAMRLGFFSMFFGLVYGSVFGNEELLNPLYIDVLGMDHKPIHVLDANFAMPLLIFACGLGFIFILISIFVNIYLNFKRKDYAEVVCSANGIAGFVFYAGIIIMLVLNMTSKDLFGYQINPFNIFTEFFIIILPLILIMFKKPITNFINKMEVTPHEGWGGFIIENIFELFEVVLSFVTNTMSYLRVGGFILSHAGMMLVVMTLKEMTGNYGIIVIIVGNIFVIALEGMIVGIQTLRLEYYEMFSRYFKSGGKKFKAISMNN